MPTSSEIARHFPIESQSSDRDKAFLLSAKRLMGDVAPGYDYLEIGSFLGGSLAPGLWMIGAAQRVLQKAMPGVLHNDLAACNAYVEGFGAASKVTCPATLVLGQRDAMTPLSAGKKLGAAIAGARLAVLEGAGHMLMAERPDEVLAALRG